MNYEDGWDFNKASWPIVTLITGTLACCVPLLMMKSWDLNVMGGGDETATSLGVNVRRVRIVTMVVATLLVACIVCFTGTIGDTSVLDISDGLLVDTWAEEILSTWINDEVTV
ncbi:iron chelate uptake ABC transporter family permease subunit [Methanococcoides sp.]|uniref:iron chelate uptake ABC transporter family permease subunit n=1 Tax=Methanococcoides sp. TaxID=1966350 RepID=UPI00272ED8BA|nr:iron chelate uptake ABC transporter family permease subunit [Methanococcoides sp.]